LIFIALVKILTKPVKKEVDEVTEKLKELEDWGIKIHSIYWTLGRYDGVLTYEAANEKEAMKLSIAFSKGVKFETMVAVPREEAIQLV
jgi:uncharacterized protein with GYD domain